MTPLPRTRSLNAESRIADVLRSHKSALDLTGLALRRVPPIVRQLTWLKHVYLQHNELTRLPSWIGELAQLRTLHVYRNPLRTVPSSLGRLVHLRSLLISGGVESAAAEVIGSLVNLEELAIDTLGLREVPN
jgi:Leucine-rich repeat (LRR) protein